MPTRSPIHLAFVNSMPDGAFEETEQQFLALLGLAGPGTGDRAGGPAARPAVDLRRYAPEERRASSEIPTGVRRRYAPVEALFATSPDGVVVTGCEPGAGRVRDESLWPLLARIFEWAPAATASLWLACLAAHAALAYFDGLERRSLPTKASGVLPQEVTAGDPLTAGLPARVAIPHSRLNEVPTSALVAAGYRLAIGSASTGWTVAAGRRGRCALVLVQGHPEYGADTLLREYRRDVRRWLKQERDDYPPVPSGYLDDAAEARFAAFRRRAQAGPRTAYLMEEFPFAEEAARLEAPWAPVAAGLGRNWLATLAGGDGPGGNGRAPVVPVAAS